MGRHLSWIVCIDGLAFWIRIFGICWRHIDCSDHEIMTTNIAPEIEFCVLTLHSIAFGLLLRSSMYVFDKTKRVQTLLLLYN